MIINDGTIRTAWEKRDRSRTSAYYSGELYEQVFGDLHSDEMIHEARHRIGHQPSLVQAIELFLDSLRRLYEWIEGHIDTDTWGEGDETPPNVSIIFDTQEWWVVQQDAMSVIAAARDAGVDVEPQTSGPID